MYKSGVMEYNAEQKRRAVKSLEERFEGYSGDYRCFEADTGKPAGMEGHFGCQALGVSF